MTWTLFEGDCFDYFHLIEDGSVDMVLCDLPYGTTACKWDTPLPLKELWEQYERVIKPNGAIVLTGSQPFTSHLVMSNPKLFKYEWIWVKNKPTGGLNAKFMPMKKHENILVFYKNKPNFNPIKIKRTEEEYKNCLRINNSVTGNTMEIYGKLESIKRIRPSPEEQWFKNPETVLYFNKPDKRDGNGHPTQKPVALFEYLIRTYTNPGDLVLDNCAGSGTTGVACENLNRNSILMEKEPEYCQIIRNRLMEVTSQKKLDVGVGV